MSGDHHLHADVSPRQAVTGGLQRKKKEYSWHQVGPDGVPLCKHLH